MARVYPGLSLTRICLSWGTSNSDAPWRGCALFADALAQAAPALGLGAAARGRGHNCPAQWPAARWRSGRLQAGGAERESSAEVARKRVSCAHCMQSSVCRVRDIQRDPDQCHPKHCCTLQADPMPPHGAHGYCLHDCLQLQISVLGSESVSDLKQASISISISANSPMVATAASA